MAGRDIFDMARDFAAAREAGLRGCGKPTCPNCRGPAFEIDQAFVGLLTAFATRDLHASASPEALERYKDFRAHVCVAIADTLFHTAVAAPQPRDATGECLAIAAKVGEALTVLARSFQNGEYEPLALGIGPDGRPVLAAFDFRKHLGERE